MPKRVILLSGPVCSGKTALARKLNDRYNIFHFKTSEFLSSTLQSGTATRRSLQVFGELLDRRTDGKWVLRQLQSVLPDLGVDSIVAVDSVRIEKQIEVIRKAFGRQVTHVHLTAPRAELAKRYNSNKANQPGELPSYDSVISNRTERLVSKLAKTADILIDTDRCTAEDVFTRIAAHLGLFGRDYERLVDVVVGGQYGSEGKGHIVSYLAPDYKWLLRVGGPNAGHQVFEEPEPYTFHCLPSGSKVPNVSLIIGPGAVISTRTLMKEVGDCQIDHNRLRIDPQAMIITAEDIRWERKHLKDSISSTAQGVGRATARRILHRYKEPIMAKDVTELRPYIAPTCEVLDDIFSNGQRVLLEGTQGTGLSIFHGHYPYVTSRDTTVAGCLSEAGVSPSRVRRIVMVCRTLPIRVQSPLGKGKTSGPMSQSISWKEVARRSGLDYAELLKVEKTSTTKRRRRVSEFDWPLLRKAASLNAPTDIALTFSDYISKENTKARRFEQLTAETIRFIEEIERVSAAPVSLISTRFHSRSIIDRRTW